MVVWVGRKIGARLIVPVLLLLVARVANLAEAKERHRADPLQAPGLLGPILQKRVPRWPVILAAPDCGKKSCNTLEEIDFSASRAAKWLARFPEVELRFDAAVILSLVREVFDSDALRSAFERARKVADRDWDHPQRRFWIADFSSPSEVTSKWELPADGERAKINDVIHEALYCREHGWREKTMEHVCGPFRDSGGYFSTHAAWVLSIVSRNGCVSPERLEPCIRSLHEELAAAQPEPFVWRKTLDIDLYAERVVGLLITGWTDRRAVHYVFLLRALQNADGGWGIEAQDEPLYYRYHATAVVLWAYAEWYRRRVESIATFTAK